MLLRESQVQPLLLVFEDLHWIDTETQALLDRLVDSLPSEEALLLPSAAQGSEFLYEAGLFPEREYTFKHASPARWPMAVCSKSGGAYPRPDCAGTGDIRCRPGGRTGRAPGAPCPAG